MPHLFAHNFWILLFFLMVGHALADFPLQGDFLAKAKNPNTDVGKQLWPWALPMHGLIHGGMVALVTGSLVFGIAEVALHCAIDFLRCLPDPARRISFSKDQTLHIVCKVVFAGLATLAVFP